VARHKRSRGGQPGNQNARKHGLYARHATSEELLKLNSLLNANCPDPSLAVLRFKVENALVNAPENHRVVCEGSALLSRYIAAQANLNRQDTSILKIAFRNVFKADATGDIEVFKRIASETLNRLGND
jgi:hypothetical protein